MIKYTGFGHAAGLFADRGLLGSINQRKDGDSEDSETEDYRTVEKEWGKLFTITLYVFIFRVNPVSGYIQPQNENNPLAGMTDEQKEHEAMKLVNAIDQVIRRSPYFLCVF